MGDLLVLIADDEPDHRTIIQLVVEELVGARAALAADGEEALSLAFRLAPDLIVLDVLMPRLDGYEVVRRLRADPATRSIPILLITADGQRQARALGAGAAGYIQKPFDIDHVAEAVRACLRRERLVETA